MLTTSRKEVCADETLSDIKNNADVTERVIGAQEIRTEQNLKNIADKNTAFKDSYFSAQQKDIAAKLFGEDFDSDEWYAINTDTENYTNPDLMPTPRTMEPYIKEQPYAGEQYNVSVGQSQRVSKKEKLAFVCYAAIVLALILVVSLMAVSVSATMKKVSDLQTNINTTVSQIDNMYSDVEANADAYAEELGLKNGSSTTVQHYEAAETREPLGYDVPDNWFNKLCEWLSQVFGG